MSTTLQVSPGLGYRPAATAPIGTSRSDAATGSHGEYIGQPPRWDEQTPVRYARSAPICPGAWVGPMTEEDVDDEDSGMDIFAMLQHGPPIGGER